MKENNMYMDVHRQHSIVSFPDFHLVRLELKGLYLLSKHSL